MPQIRPARPEDAAAVLRIQGEAAAERATIATWPEEMREVAEEADVIAKRSREEGILLVAEEGAEIVGICGVHLEQRYAMRHVAELGITVAGAHRGRGAGRALMLAAEEWARGCGVRKMTLGVFVDNERARRLYRSLGYVEEGIRRGHYHVGEGLKDEVLMAKWL